MQEPARYIRHPRLTAARRLLTGVVSPVLCVAVVAVVASPPARASTTAAIPIGVLQPGGSLFPAEHQAGLSLASIEISWSAAETANGVWDENYFTSIRSRISAATGAGLSPVLALGIQYPPTWVFGLDPASRLVDQYGDTWATSPGSGDDVVNGVFSPAIRNAISTYTARVFAELGTGFTAVRWGGGLPYDEVRYPGCPSGRSNCYWAFDANARAGSPVPGYVPGSGDPAKAQAFLDYYLKSLSDYVTWGLATLRASYKGEVDVLMPSWGVRPGDLTQAVGANLNGATVRTSEITAGLDWARQLPSIAGYGNVVAWCTWLNRLDDNTDVASLSPAHYLASIAPSGMGVGGENTYGAATTTDLQNTISNARAYAPRRVLWMSESLTQQPGNATLVQLGQAAADQAPAAPPPAPAAVVAFNGSDGALHVKHADGIHALGGYLLSAPAVVAVPGPPGPTALYIGVGGDHRLYVRSDTQGWQSLLTGPNGCYDSPAATITTINGSSVLTVACEGGDAALYYWQGPLSGTGLPLITDTYHSLGGGLLAGPAVGDVGGVLTFVALGGDHYLYTRTLTQNYVRLPAQCIGHPALAGQGSTAYIACHGMDGALFHSTNVNNSWGQWVRDGGQIIDGPGIALTSSGVSIFVEGGDSSIYHTVLAQPGFVADGGILQYGAAAAGLAG